MTSFISVCFSGRANLKQIEEKTAQYGFRGHALPKKFRNFTYCNSFFSAFEQILIKLFSPHSESFTKYDAFCLHVFDLCVLTSGQEWI